MSRAPVEVVALSDLVESTPTRSCAYGSWDGRLRVSQAMSRSGAEGGKGERSPPPHVVHVAYPLATPQKLIPSPQIA